MCTYTDVARISRSTDRFHGSVHLLVVAKSIANNPLKFVLELEEARYKRNCFFCFLRIAENSVACEQQASRASVG